MTTVQAEVTLPPSTEETAPAGRITAVFAAKGGCGKSTVATNLAVSLGGGGAAVCLIDLDLAFGDVGLMLGLAPDHTMADALPIADRIDETGLRILLTRHTSGIDVLLAPVDPTVAEKVGPDLVRRVLRLAGAMFDHVVVDCASQFTEAVLAALDEAHQHILVTTPELPSVKSLRVTLDMFDLLGYSHDDRVVVLNRADAKVGLSPADVEQVLQTRIDMHIPSSRDVPVCINLGVPIVAERPNHPVSAALGGLANKRVVQDDAPAPRGLRRLMPRRTAAAANGRSDV